MGRGKKEVPEMLDLLRGRTISEVYVDPEYELMFLVANEGTLRMSLSGDCCSNSWFSDIYNFDALIGVVSDAREIELPDYDVDDGRTRQESDSAYGVEVSTNKGTAKIVFRNSSNGYYGGWLQDVEQVDSLPDGLARITDDWKA